MSGLAVAIHLSGAELKLLTKVHKSHLGAMGTEEREQFSSRNISEVKRNISEKCLEVYFNNGEWFKYYTNGTWG